jgi:hypothetical protein
MLGQVVSPNGVKLAGSFNGFSTTSTPMTNAGNGIFEVTLSLQKGTQQIFKYVNGNQFELVDASCGILGSQSTYDRFIDVPTSNKTLELVCFNSCDNSCSTNPKTVDVVFRVNMLGQVTSPNGIKLAGSFNGFSTSATPMINVGNNIFEATLKLTSGTLITYKFVNGNNFEIIPTSCGLNDGLGNFNRSLSVPAINTVLNTVCFNLCDNKCSTITNTVNVTFKVDLQGQIVSSSGIKLAGSFNSFSTSSTPMINIGNNIYEVTLPLIVGSQQIFKYVNGNQFELIDSVCGLLGGQSVYDRFVDVPATNVVLNLVCFNSCTSCQGLETTQFSNQKIKVYPNPVKSGQKINIILQQNEVISLYDFTGKLVNSQMVKAANAVFNIPAVSPGVYLMKSSKGSKKIIVE